MSAEPISDLEIHAFIDGELAPDRAERVAQRLATDRALAALVEAYRADQTLLARVYDPVLAWTSPPDIRVPAPGRRLAAWRLGAMAAAAAILLVIGGLAVQRIDPGGDRLLVAAVAARDGAATPEDQLVDPPPSADATSAAVSRYLGVTVGAPDLSKAGWMLSQVGFYSAAAGHFVELRYADAAGRLFTIALQAKPGKQRFEMTRHDALWTCVWQNDELEAVMLGEVSQHEMLRLATMTYSALGF